MVIPLAEPKPRRQRRRLVTWEFLNGLVRGVGPDGRPREPSGEAWDDIESSGILKDAPVVTEKAGGLTADAVVAAKEPDQARTEIPPGTPGDAREPAPATDGGDRSAGTTRILGERHRIIINDWQAADMSSAAGRLLWRAADMLDRVDFTPAALRADLADARTAPRRLYSAAELTDHAADLLSDSAGLVHDNERRWRTFRARVAQLVGSPVMGTGTGS